MYEWNISKRMCDCGIAIRGYIGWIIDSADMEHPTALNCVLEVLLYRMKDGVYLIARE